MCAATPKGHLCLWPASTTGMLPQYAHHRTSLSAPSRLPQTLANRRALATSRSSPCQSGLTV